MMKLSAVSYQQSGIGFEVRRNPAASDQREFNDVGAMLASPPDVHLIAAIMQKLTADG